MNTKTIIARGVFFDLLIMAVVVFLFSLLLRPAEIVPGEVVGVSMAPATTVATTECNGDPVLLICDDAEMSTPAKYFAEVNYPSGFKRKDGLATAPCRVEITRDQYRSLSPGEVLKLKNSILGGSCSQA